MLQMRFPAAKIPCPPHPSIARRLREGAFYPSPHTIEPLKSLCLLTEPSRLEHFMAFSWSAHRHASPRGAGISTALADWARLAGVFGKQDQHDRFALGIRARIPSTILLALRAGHLLVFPVKVKLRDI